MLHMVFTIKFSIETFMSLVRWPKRKFHHLHNDLWTLSTIHHSFPSISISKHLQTSSRIRAHTNRKPKKSRGNICLFWCTIQLKFKNSQSISDGHFMCCEYFAIVKKMRMDWDGNRGDKETKLNRNNNSKRSHERRTHFIKIIIPMWTQRRRKLDSVMAQTHLTP